MLLHKVKKSSSSNAFHAQDSVVARKCSRFERLQLSGGIECKSSSSAIWGGGALPYVGRYQLPVIRPPFFHANPTPNNPLFPFSPHPMTLFFQFCKEFYIEISKFCTLHAHLNKFIIFRAICAKRLQILA